VHARPKHRPNRPDHLVRNAPVFFDEAPEFINLYCGQAQIPNEVLIDSRPVLPCQLQPVQHGINFTVFDPADGSQAVAFDQHADGIQQNRARSPDRFKKRALVCTESALTGCAVKSALRVAVNLDVANADFANIEAGGVVTPSAFSFHCASFLSGECADFRSKKAFPA
jgi:hypothetical protein